MIQLNYRDSKPIYEQIKDGYIHLIVSGVMKNDEKLPSVREIASSLAINPNTIQRAYKQLETEGYIYTISGKGSFVSEVSGILEERSKKLMDKFDEIVRELLYLSECGDELKKRIDILEGEELKKNDRSK
ncbi:MAG: GntR family transcriptional regulator [Lachnospiraceae bacterium]|nr:GntR family transcriptional regulator [Lachnospiraceae bacterium]